LLLLLRRTRTAAAGLLLPLLLLLLLRLLRTFAVALPRLAVGARAALRARLVVATALALRADSPVIPAAADLTGALLVLAHLLFHEPARVLVELRAQLVASAVGAALPAFGVGPFAAGTED
jgi:hypothetical protein